MTKLITSKVGIAKNNRRNVNVNIWNFLRLHILRPWLRATDCMGYGAQNYLCWQTCPAGGQGGL
jgi:hypothetical protein